MTDTVVMPRAVLRRLVERTRCDACECELGAPGDARELCRGCRRALVDGARSEDERRALTEE